MAFGIFREDGDAADDGDGGDEGDIAEGRSLFINATSDFVTDLSAAANPLVAVGNLPESFPGKKKRSTSGRKSDALGVVHKIFDDKKTASDSHRKY